MGTEPNSNSRYTGCCLVVHSLLPVLAADLRLMQLSGAKFTTQQFARQSVMCI